MNVRIETYGEYKYDEIQKEYGSVLNKFGLSKLDDDAYISINCLEDIFNLDKEIRAFCEEHDEDIYYFGIMIKHFNGEPLLEIKDNFD